MGEIGLLFEKVGKNETLTPGEREQLKNWGTRAQQTLGTIDAMLSPMGGLVVKSINIGNQALFLGAARMFVDGSGNVQFRMDGTGAFTFSHGNLIVNQPSPTDVAHELHEDNVRKASFWWDVSLNNLSVENYESGGHVVIVTNDGDYHFHDRNTGETNAKVLKSGVFSLKDGVTAPDAEAGYAQIYVDTADGALKVKFGDGFVATLAADA